MAAFVPLAAQGLCSLRLESAGPPGGSGPPTEGGAMRILRRSTLLVAVLALLAAACTDEPEPAAEGEGQEEAQAEQQESLLQVVQDRGTLRCGVNNTVPGFGFETAEGVIEGFDIDFCKAFAAAVFATPDPQEGEHFELVPIDADFRFTALRDGQYDVLVRNTTWTSSRDGTEGVAFMHPNYYDGQAMMVRRGDFASIDEMDGTAGGGAAGGTPQAKPGGHLWG